MTDNSDPFLKRLFDEVNRARMAAGLEPLEATAEGLDIKRPPAKVPGEVNRLILGKAVDTAESAYQRRLARELKAAEAARPGRTPEERFEDDEVDFRITRGGKP